MFCEKCGNKLTEDSSFCDNCGCNISGNIPPINMPPVNIIPDNQNEKANKHNRKVLYIVLTVIAILVIIGIFSNSSNNSNSEIKPIDNSNTANIKTTEQQNNETSEKQEKALVYEKISEAVVNILCPYASEPFSIGSNGTGGSGTIIDASGLVVSNSHIIPQNKKSLNISEQGCFVILPDINTGAPKEIYLAKPIVFNNLSDEYDLAFLTIYNVYTDEDGEKYGQYPKELPTFDDTELCEDGQIKLGESVRILGYPVSSGGYNLTITDGIVSSFSDDGNILTSAKIDQGNSGGLAIDKDGCMIGIPSAVSEGKYDKLGVIIPASTIVKFIDEVDKQLNQ
jgi:cell division protein FtsL